MNTSGLLQPSPPQYLTPSGPIVVTGASGWLGRNLLGALIHGLPELPDLLQVFRSQPIRVLVLPGTSLAMTVEPADLEVFEGDLRSEECCRDLLENTRGGMLFHCAGVIHPRRSADFFSINVGGTCALLEEAARAGIRRAVLVSSNSPCGVNPSPEHRFDEDSPYQPYMNYGKSKMLMEQEARRISEQSGLEVVIIRAPWFYGPGQPERQTLFFKMIRDGKIPLVGTGDNFRSMVYIDNLCQGLLLASVVPQAAGRTYWIADPRPYTINEIIDTVEHLLEKEFHQDCRHRRLRLPGWFAEAARVVDMLIQYMGFYHQKIHVLSEMNKNIACRVDKARLELGYRPSVVLEEGMRRSLQWLCDQQKEAGGSPCSI